ncbi:hypothetical protein B0T14DRAFT_560555 [Immersiella caudata]|uniref:DUF7924 domain-containing protein n=1 Tax=Immersiella caudata TaxID=314043 RepID=A0AA39XFA8_9PEZI|nr:hypothetical protein B0T14DRAFT_560555 [Immersiella caudata]
MQPRRSLGLARGPTTAQARQPERGKLRKLPSPDPWDDSSTTGGTGGDIWTAANQCAGALAACVQAVDQLNTVLGEVGCRERVLNLCYSLAVDNNLAQLYASWRDENDKTVYIQRVDFLLLSNPDYFARLHQWVLVILAWGRGARLDSIRRGLDLIIETRQKAASKLAKSRLVVGLEGGRRRPAGPEEAATEENPMKEVDVGLVKRELKARRESYY